MAADPLALPEHTPEWVDAVCAVGPFTDATRLYEFADGRQFVLPLVRRSGPRGVGGWLWSLPRSWGSGGLIGSGLDVDVVGAMLDDLKSLRAARVVIRPDPLRDEWKKATVHREVPRLPRRLPKSASKRTGSMWRGGFPPRASRTCPGC